MATGVKKKPVAALLSDWSLIADLPIRIGNGWDTLLIGLGLTSANLDHINHNHHLLADKIKDGLGRWNKERKPTPEWQRARELLEALRAADMTSLADDLEDEYYVEEGGGIIPNVTDDSQEPPGHSGGVQKSPGDISVVYTREPSGDIMDNPVNEKEDISEEGSIVSIAQAVMETGPDGDFLLRDYQKEIAQDGIRGHNSIIWAGTGSGKTRVAVYIMKNHLDNNPTGRIAFFNTTLTLLDQQHEVICKFLPKYKIMKFSGRDQHSEPLSVAVRDCRVCVLTPVTLERNLIDGALSLDVFTMLVFDECHHTRKNEPYNQIMSHYRKLEANTAKLPQIIGLTASIGTERAWNVQDAEKSIINLMARMDVHKIATPRDNIDEYKRFVPDPIKHSEVTRDRKIDPISDTIEQAMGRLEGWLRTKLCDTDVYNVLADVPYTHRMEHQYQSWLSRLLIDLQLSKELTSDVIHRAIVITEHLTMYHTALSLNHTLSMKDVLVHLYHSSLKYKILDREDRNAVIIDRTSEDNTGMDTTSEGNTDEDNTVVDNTVVDNTGEGNTGMENAGVEHTDEDNRKEDNTAEDNTCVEHTDEDNKGVEHTDEDNTSEENTDEDNTVVDNTYMDITGEGNTGMENTGVEHTDEDNRKEDNTGCDMRKFTVVSLYKDVVKELERLSKNPEFENPNIVRLQEMVDTNFQEKGEDSMFIVFVETRESAIAVSKYLREKSSAKCCHLISARNMADDDGQSQAEHNRVVRLLQARQINGVVATQVAEEGLDIPACNFVIRYNKTSNEISTIQAAGRSREIQGTIIDFANQQKNRQEKVNVMRLILMNEARDNILRQSDDDIRRKVTQRMRTITETEAEEERIKHAQMRIKTQGNFTLRCSKCQKMAVSSYDIRCYNKNQFIVVNREFYTKVKLRPNSKVSAYANLNKKYKIDCKNCDWDWGAGADCKNNMFCALLKIHQFIVRDDDTGIEYTRKRWSKLPFTVQVMTEEDFSSLAGVKELIEQDH